MRMREWAVRVLPAVLAVAMVLPTVAADTEERIENLEREVAELRELLGAEKEDGEENARLEEIERRIDILANELESLRSASPGGSTASEERSTKQTT